MKRPQKMASTEQATKRSPPEKDASGSTDAADDESGRNVWTVATRHPDRRGAEAGSYACYDGPGIPPRFTCASSGGTRGVRSTSFIKPGVQESSPAKRQRIGFGTLSLSWWSNFSSLRDAAATGLLRMGTMEYAVEINSTYSHMDGSKDCPQAYRRQKEILGERITHTCMEVIIREEWIRLEKATGTVVFMSGNVMVAEEDGQVIADDGLYVCSQPSESGEMKPQLKKMGPDFSTNFADKLAG
jgi:hypothetical protein